MGREGKNDTYLIRFPPLDEKNDFLFKKREGSIRALKVTLHSSNTV